MISFFVYDINTGRVFNKCITPDKETASLQCDKGFDFIECEATAKDSDCYVDLNDGAIKTKEEIAPLVSLSEGQAVISGLPHPCSVEVDEVMEEVTNSAIAIEFDAPGVYIIEINSPPRYLDKTLEVEIP